MAQKYYQCNGVSARSCKEATRRFPARTLSCNHRSVPASALPLDGAQASRRAVVALIVGLGAGTASGALANPLQGEPTPAVAFPVATPTPTPQPNDPTVFIYEFASDVPCNLRVREYWSIINQQRPRTWQQIAQQIQTGNYANLSINLNVVPMADLRQAALYLPWALLQSYDYNAAVDAFKAYKNFDEHVKDLQRAASTAAAFAQSDATQQAQQAQLAQQVQQAFFLMSASLDGYLATVPARYTATLGLFQQQQPQLQQASPPQQQQAPPLAAQQEKAGGAGAAAEQS